MPAVVYTPRVDGKREFQVKPTAADRPVLNPMLLLNEMESLREEVRKHYEVMGCVPGLVPGDATLTLFVCGWDMYLPQVVGVSTARACVAASADFVLSLWRNETQIGTLTFAAGETAGVFSWEETSPAFQVGDIFRIVSQAQEDLTLADIAWRMLFYRS